jgi:phosphoserine phosphatase
MAGPPGDPAESSTLLYLLAFAKSHLEEAKWALVRDGLLAALGSTLLESRALDQGRVAEFSFGMEKPWSLEECAVFCRSTSGLQELETTHNVEFVLQPGHLYKLHKEPGLAIFDMDSTLIQQEVIDELARAVGLYDKVSAITEAAMRGEAPYTDFEASLRARVALLKGVPTSIWDQLKAGTITFTPGAKELSKILRTLGWKTAVLSGGFTPLAYWVKETLGLDAAHANRLVADEEQHILTGELVPEAPIIHAEKKRMLLKELAANFKIPKDQIIAVGDGSNDLLMMHEAGLGIAFNAKPKVQQAAPARLNSKTLLDVIHILGYTKDEINELLERSK